VLRAAGPEHRWSVHSSHCAVSVALAAVERLVPVGVSVTSLIGGNVREDEGHDHEKELAMKGAHGWLMLLAWTLIIPIGRCACV
jgi:hypothetical protein